MVGVSFLAKTCTWMFYFLLAYVLLFGGETRFILENGLSAVGNLVQNFFALSTYTDPTRETNFAQNWTIFYWAYWMVWCVAAPFFIGSISRGRTVRSTLLGGYVFGLGSTFVSFIILGNYGLGLQVLGKMDIVSFYEKSKSLYATIIAIMKNLPFAPLVLGLLIVTMIAFYATTFDSIALVAAQYSYKNLGENEEPAQSIKVFWSVLLILLPLALVFSESSMANLQSVSIIAAFPIGIIILMIAASFMKDAKKYMKELDGQSSAT
jgi:BCCT family betaine/carnitine transporter